jgi:cell division protein ZapE
MTTALADLPLETLRNPLAEYQRMLAVGSLSPDPVQEKVVFYLQEMADSLIPYLTFPTRRSLLKRVLPFHRSQEILPVRSLYVYGDVGRGKSMLMDLFYRSLPEGAKRRLHFHAFMMEVHQRIHRWRQESQGNQKEKDPIPPVARALASGMKMLCLDELQVTDVADAMILSRLFTALKENGVVVFITSNRAPEDLYQGGMQREHFMKFVHIIHAEWKIIELKSPHDYRLSKMRALQSTYLWPLGYQSEAQIEQAYQTLASAPEETTAIQVLGRTLTFPQTRDDLLRTSFQELCCQPLGAADYLAIAERFRTVILEDVPALSLEKRNEAKRFVTLIDALYDCKVKCIFSAEVPPEKLYPSGDGSFEFQRTVSRLMEMQSESYWQLHHCYTSTNE